MHYDPDNHYDPYAPQTSIAQKVIRYIVRLIKQHRHTGPNDSSTTPKNERPDHDERHSEQPPRTADANDGTPPYGPA
ncbi:Uncharacterised protein [Slackia heliotrinireducens]|uniref:Uncharacterized protein n=1 Tax=Slackia heliotrinireducens (strain ATCC 29202 / DSM 20476 / NCTC 11029 / RHS 1) TaxID=471855 RepID=C7N7D6_SLAHD|nr:hypothetical protein [Slackia heliotrinireducens]ACV22821.1 hypothetical protein Shel_18030 [Slackia heliotrinireducens DSM 20476]VEH01544.1 Uncharacterised protein [Slackia heliotrinireducens]